jgi:hypothetical protein
MSWGLTQVAATPLQLAPAVQAVCHSAVSCKATSSSNSKEAQQQLSYSKASREGQLQLAAQV